MPNESVAQSDAKKFAEELFSDLAAARWEQAAAKIDAGHQDSLRNRSISLLTAWAATAYEAGLSNAQSGGAVGQSRGDAHDNLHIKTWPGSPTLRQIRELTAVRLCGFLMEATFRTFYGDEGFRPDSIRRVITHVRQLGNANFIVEYSVLSIDPPNVELTENASLRLRRRANTWTVVPDEEMISGSAFVILQPPV